MSNILHNMGDREVATVLHSLRLMQLGCNADSCDHFDEVEPLSSHDIDVLCESINLAPAERTITVWSVTSNLISNSGRNGLETSIYLDQHEAFMALVEKWAKSDEQTEAVARFLENKQYKMICEETAPGVWDDLDSFIIRSHEIEIPVR